MDLEQTELTLDNNDDDIKDDLLDTELMMQEEMSETFEVEITDEEDVDDIVDEEESIDNTINYDDSESELDVYFKYGTNNHKLDGKHSLKRDTILNGKLSETTDVEDDGNSQFGLMEFDIHDSGEIPIERGSIFEEESRNAEDSQNKRKLAEDVYYLLKNNTDLDFRSNRRKPNKATFNNYYKMLLCNIDQQYTKNEIFVELAYYFTDNIFNMYKLLDKKYATAIIREIKEKGFLNNLGDFDFT